MKILFNFLEFIETTLGKVLKVLLVLLNTFVFAFAVVFLCSLAYGAFKELDQEAIIVLYWNIEGELA
jgi:hypothetical protein